MIKKHLLHYLHLVFCFSLTPYNLDKLKSIRINNKFKMSTTHILIGIEATNFGLHQAYNTNNTLERVNQN